ncbi:hypothetical protein JTB14_027217 [Gonioctena quinquepunctata]|nr:hypothetical protein JTB14_027217 [Gonioctena quinquepunctata]
MQRAKNHMVALEDGRNRGQPHNKIDDEVIRTHILSFNPTISHYRREHAPIRLTVVKEPNISIVELGHEECELCEELTLHDPNHTKENSIPDCDICSKWKVHIDKATTAREKYREDAEKTEDVGKEIYYADLEKRFTTVAGFSLRKTVCYGSAGIFQTFEPPAQYMNQEVLFCVDRNFCVLMESEDVCSVDSRPT